MSSSKIGQLEANFVLHGQSFCFNIFLSTGTDKSYLNFFFQTTFLFLFSSVAALCVNPTSDKRGKPVKKSKLKEFDSIKALFHLHQA